MVSLLAFYSDNSSLNPADAYSYFCKILCLKRIKINKKDAGVGPFSEKKQAILFMLAN